MIPVPGGVRVWLATGVTDMRRGMNTLALQVQEDLGRDPHAGDLYIFRGRRGDLVKCLRHDGVGISLYAKRLEPFEAGLVGKGAGDPALTGAAWPGDQQIDALAHPVAIAQAEHAAGVIRWLGCK